jgi:hypothetical protein
MAIAVEIAAPTLPHQGIKINLRPKARQTKIIVNIKSYLYFFDVVKIAPLSPKYISTSRATMRNRKIQIPT